MGFEPAIPASERPQIHALDRAATGTDTHTHTRTYIECIYMFASHLAMQKIWFLDSCSLATRIYYFGLVENVSVTLVLNGQKMLIQDCAHVYHFVSICFLSIAYDTA